MATEVRTPLEQSREDALRYFVRLFAWGYTPVAAAVAVHRWLMGPSLNATRAVLVICTPFVFLALLIWRLRPGPARSQVSRGKYAIVMTWLVTCWGLLLNGPRAPNTVGVAVTLGLAVLFLDERRQFWGVVAATMLVGLLGVTLRSVGILSAPPLENVQQGPYELASGAMIILGFAYCGYLFWTTLENYRKGQRALNAMTAELLASQATSQGLLRQEMLARLATTLAGQVAAELDTASSAWRAQVIDQEVAYVGPGAPLKQIHEAGTRATQALRLLESLGQPRVLAGHPVDLQHILQRVDDTIRPIIPFGHSLEVQHAATTEPLIDGERLEQVIVYLALQLKQQFGAVGDLLIRSYDGLGDMSRPAGARTWTIVDIGYVIGTDPTDSLSTSNRNAGMVAAARLLELALGEVGARLEMETRDGNVFYVLQLPSG